MAGASSGDKLQAALNKIAANLAKASEVSVGFQNGATEADGTLVALVAALNEYGTARIPSRPFFRNAISDNKAKWPTNLATALKANEYDAAKALGLVGQEIKEEIEASIVSNTPPPNAPSTIACKGFDATLIDTSTMLHSVTSVVK